MSRLVLVLLLVGVLTEEHYETVIERDQDIMLSEHIYEDRSMHLAIRGINMEATDRFKVTVHYRIIENNFQKDIANLDTTPVKDLEFIGSMADPFFETTIRPYKGLQLHGQFISVRIKNKGDNAIKVGLLVKQFHKKVQKTRKTATQQGQNNHTSHTVEGNVRYQSLSFLHYLAYKMNVMSKQLVIDYNNLNNVEQAQFKEGDATQLSQTIKLFSVLSMLANVAMSFIIMLGVHLYLNRKKNV